MLTERRGGCLAHKDSRMIKCASCGREFNKFVTHSHIRVCCGLTMKEYEIKFGCSPFSDEYRSDRAKQTKVYSNRPEIKERSRKRLQKLWANPEYAKKQTELANATESKNKRQETLRNRFANEPEFRKKIRAALSTPEVIKKISEGASRTFDQKRKALAAGQRNRMTLIHRKVKAALNKFGLFGFQSEVIVGRFLCDEVDETNNVIVEANGCFWHGCKKCYTDKDTKQYSRILILSERSRIKMDELRSLGWRVIEVWEHDSAEDVILKWLSDLMVKGAKMEEVVRSWQLMLAFGS